MNIFTPILYHVTIRCTIIICLQNHGRVLNIQQPFGIVMCDKLCKTIGECSSFQFDLVYLRCLLLKAAGISDMEKFQPNGQNCFTSTEHSQTLDSSARGQNHSTSTEQPWTKCHNAVVQNSSTSTEHPWTPDDSTSGYRCHSKGTSKQPKNCRQLGYRSVRAGRDRIYIRFHPQKRTWEEALEICCSENGIIAVPNTKDKERVMIKRIPTHLARGVDPIWIGLRDIGQNNTYLWIDGSPVSYVNWARGNPTYTYVGYDADCVRVITHMKVLLKIPEWSDNQCGELYGFICQCF